MSRGFQLTCNKTKKSIYVSVVQILRDELN